MNREERRSLMKQGASKETVDKVSAMTSPCSIAECVQISRASAEDVVADYHRNQGNVQLAMSLQIEIIRDALISAGIISEEEFKEKYMEEAKKLQQMQMDMMQEEMNASGVTDMKVSAGDVEVKIEE